MFAKISRVEKVNYVILKTNPPIYVIQACGIVPTSGWGDGQLVPYVYITPPSDGIQDFDFIAKPPTGYVLQIESPIEAQWDGVLPNWLQGVRIHAAQNSQEFSISERSDVRSMDITIAGGEIPWPLRPSAFA